MNCFPACSVVFLFSVPVWRVEDYFDECADKVALFSEDVKLYTAGLFGELTWCLDRVIGVLISLIFRAGVL